MAGTSPAMTTIIAIALIPLATADTVPRA